MCFAFPYRAWTWCPGVGLFWSLEKGLEMMRRLELLTRLIWMAGLSMSRNQNLHGSELWSLIYCFTLLIQSRNWIWTYHKFVQLLHFFYQYFPRLYSIICFLFKFLRKISYYNDFFFHFFRKFWNKYLFFIKKSFYKKKKIWIDCEWWKSIDITT